METRLRKGAQAADKFNDICELERQGCGGHDYIIGRVKEVPDGDILGWCM